MADENTGAAAAAAGTQGAAGAPGAAAGSPDLTQGGKTLPVGGADGGGAGIHKPAGIGEHQLGQTNEETIDKLWKENLGFREAQSKQPKALSKIEDVKFDWSDKVKAMGGIATDDKAVAMFADVAVKHGFMPTQLAAIPAFFDAAIEAKLIEPPFDSNKVLEDLAPDNFKGTPEQRQMAGSPRMIAASNYIKQLPPGLYDDDMKNELMLLTTSKGGVRALEALMSGGNQSVSAGGGQRAAAVSEGDLSQMTADPRNWPNDPKYDPAYATEVAAKFKAFYGS